MKTYNLVGVSKIDFKDKQTGAPRILTRLHLTYQDDTERGLVGSGVQTEVVSDRVFQASGYEPMVGDTLQLFYEPDFRGQARLSFIQPV